MRALLLALVCHMAGSQFKSWKPQLCFCFVLTKSISERDLRIVTSHWNLANGSLQNLNPLLIILMSQEVRFFHYGENTNTSPTAMEQIRCDLISACLISLIRATIIVLGNF
jgi:hypothetical protein